MHTDLGIQHDTSINHPPKRTNDLRLLIKVLFEISRKKSMTGQEVTLVTALLAGLSVLSGVVVHLWKKLSNVTTDLEKKLENCELQHDAANKYILGLSVELAEIKGKTTTMNELKHTLIEIIKEQKYGKHDSSS